MMIEKLAAICGFAACLGLTALTPAFAQSGPKVLPPATFKGTQYVDSDGCVYIRAGVDNIVRWVPRVTRDRRQVCGFVPTLDASAAGRTAPVTSVEVISVSDTTPRPAVAEDRFISGKSPASSALGAHSSEERFIPDHTKAENAAMRSVTVPKGFEKVWQDDRLNVRRAEQTRTGQQQTEAIWTNTVPRRLVE
ncbi:MAG: hypothetical protein AB8B58_00600 [Roseobacter sp.]